ncbi:MAG: triose-phosphate isomerase [Planctomycetota bacterium]|nr:triose-phosphate isomerase [Planctomycetota bacterium]MDA1024861.1 triose-phosphate isomerase [Planctomycetota bacterium]
MSTRRPYVGGNWKMHGELAAAVELTENLVAAIGNTVIEVDIAIFPPFPYLQAVGHALGHAAILLGGQDCAAHLEGAHTGQTSPAMIADLGGKVALVGHSERRHELGESDAVVAAKARAALAAELQPVICVGETLAQREAGNALQVVEKQVRAALEGLSAPQVGRVVVAYEPVWAIGTGMTATPDDAQSAHAMIRTLLCELYDTQLAGSVRIIYGGSVKAANAAELFAAPDVDGGLIGGASLKVEDFSSICRAASSS